VLSSTDNLPGRAHARARKHRLGAHLITLLIATAGCGGARPAAPPPAAPPGPPPAPATASEPPLPPDVAASIEHSCGLGAPRKLADFGETVLIGRRGYALEHSSTRKIALWVCQHIARAELHPAHPRHGRFLPDPLLSPGRRAELADYRRSGLDRGHMAPAADFRWDETEMQESFFLSNVAPQVGPGFNRTIWAALEEHVRELVSRHGEVYAVTGGYFRRQAAVRTIGDNKVHVPDGFYKVLAFRRGADRSLTAAGYALANQPHPDRRYQRFATSVDVVERLSELDFWPLLPDGEEARIEAAQPTVDEL